MSRRRYQAVQASAELACVRYLTFLGASCLISSIYLGWEVLFVWLVTWWGLRQFCRLLGGSSRR